jgi:DNA-binding response OmpR family regulator
MASKILVVDDEPSIVEMLTYNLEQADYNVVSAYDGEEALAIVRSEHPDLIVLDLMLPKVDGFEVCRIVRNESNVPIIMLTARGAEVDRVVGLELGADDYVVKPFSIREFMVRVKNILKRSNQSPPEVDTEDLRIGDLVINNSTREVCLGPVELELTTLEFDVLYTLASQVRCVLSREQLIEKVWGYNYYGDTRVVDAVIKRLRKKLRQAAPSIDMITSIRGIGYKMSA